MTLAKGHIKTRAMTACLASVFAMSAYVMPTAAQSTTTSKSIPASKTTSVAPPTGLSVNIPRTVSSNTLDMLGDFNIVGLSPTLAGALTDVPLESASMFNFNFADTGCLSGESFCFSPDRDAVDIVYAKPNYLSLNKKGLDLELTPSASMRFGDDSSSAVVGALLRIGDDLRQDSDFSSNTWYIFAGADAEALTYRPGSQTRNGFNLQDRLIVGDAQAGVGYRIGDAADVSLAYMRREVSGFSNNDITEDMSFTEDAAALSFTWRR